MKQKAKEKAVVWIKGLVSAFIGGFANGLASIGVNGEVFNFGDGLLDLGKMCLLGGVIMAAAYLKKAPLPGGAK